MKRLPLESRFHRASLTGRDALNFTHRILSRNFKTLSENCFVPGTLLTPEGRVASWFFCQKSGETADFITTPPEWPHLRSGLEKYLFSESIEFQELGPIELAVRLKDETDLTTKPLLEFSSLQFFEDGLESSEFDRFSESEWNALRALARLPIRGVDFDTPPLVFELGFEKFCDPNKGCYVGQEVVERVVSRGGSSPRVLACLESEHPLEPQESLVMESEIQTEKVGQATKSVGVLNARNYSLAYIHRKYLDGRSFVIGEKSRNKAEIKRLPD